MLWDSFWITKSQLESSEKERGKQSWESQLVLCCGGKTAKLVSGLSGLDGAQCPEPDCTSSVTSQWPWEKHMTNGT